MQTKSLGILILSLTAFLFVYSVNQEELNVLWQQEPSLAAVFISATEEVDDKALMGFQSTSSMLDKAIVS